MIIEPTPTNPRSPLRRALGLVALAIPVVLLGTVVGAGLLGPRPDASPAPTSPTAGSSPVAAPASVAPAVIAAGEPAAAPTQFGDLPAWTPGTLPAWPDRARAARTLALTGFLRIDGPVDGSCIDEAGDPLGPWCERQGILADSRSDSETPAQPFPPHVHLTIPVGVRLPAAIAGSADAPFDGGSHVLVVGRFGRAASDCRTPARACDERFIVERFAWVDGVRVGLTPLISDRLDTGARRPNPFLFLDAADLPLAATLVWPDAVAALDPAAARIAAAGPPSEPVWYVRALDGARGPGMDRGVRWMLLAERDLRVLGAGRPMVQGTEMVMPEPG